MPNGSPRFVFVSLYQYRRFDINTLLFNWRRWFGGSSQSSDRWVCSGWTCWGWFRCSSWIWWFSIQEFGTVVIVVVTSVPFSRISESNGTEQAQSTMTPRKSKGVTHFLVLCFMKRMQLMMNSTSLPVQSAGLSYWCCCCRRQRSAVSFTIITYWLHVLLNDIYVNKCWWFDTFTLYSRFVRPLASYPTSLLVGTPYVIPNIF